MKHTLLRLTLYTAIALVPIGCGYRKAAVDITSNKAVQDTKQTESTQSTDSSTSKSVDAKTSTETNTSEGATTTNVKKYDANTGKLVEERTTVSNKKKAATKQQAENKTLDVTNYHLVNMERVITTHVKQTEYIKSKKTSRNSTIWLVITGLVSFGLGLWISPKVAKWFKG